MSGMRFLWPGMLWLLLAAPLLVAAYVWLQRRRKAQVAVFSSLSLVREAMSTRQRIRRHVPPALLLAALLALALGMGRPSAVVTLPMNQKTILMAIDVSLSMRATDVDPDRITAAKAAAKSFIQELPANVRVGIVTFAGTASLVQRPTSDREALLAAIDRFELQRATATGSGLLVSLAALFPDHGIDLEAAIFGSPSYDPRAPREARDRVPGALSDGRGSPAAKDQFTPVPPGSHESAVIILLSDGRRTTGPDPLEAAKMAADRGVRVYTVGFGTVEGTSATFDGGWTAFLRLDEDTLKAIADITRAEYFYAGTAADLRKVYESLNNRLVLEKQETEITALFAAVAAALTLMAALLSLRWFHRPA